MNFELVPVTGQTPLLQPVLQSLAKMYCYEWSQYNGIEVNEQGDFPFEKYVPTYWQSPARRAFLFRVSGDAGARWAGFALMDEDFVLEPAADHSMAEFFVMHRYRRVGLGKWAALELFRRFPGEWELGRNPKNLGSVPFWDRVVSEATGGAFVLKRSAPEHRYPDGTLGDVFRFRI